jgi:transposase
MITESKQLKTIRIILKPLNRQKRWLMKKAESIPKELLPIYQRGEYPEGCARIVNNAIQKIWTTMRSTKQIPIDKQISKIIKKNGVLFLKLQAELVPFRIKAVDKLDDLLLNHFNSAVVWLKGDKWIADVQVEVENHYVQSKAEAVVGIDLGKFHTCYSVWVEGKEVYRAFDSFGTYHKTMSKIQGKIALAQSNFKGTRKQLSAMLKPLYEKKRSVLRQYYGTLRNRILSHIPENHNAVFVIEDLDTLPRAELSKAQRTWAHQELANGIFASQIEWNGYKVVKVDAKGTTHTCWKCGAPVKSNKERKVICGVCYPKGLDRDLNGARNIAKRYMLLGIPQHTCSGTEPIAPLKPCA